MRTSWGLHADHVIIDEIQDITSFREREPTMARKYTPRKNTYSSRIMDYLKQHPNKVLKGREILDGANLYSVTGEGHKSYSIGSAALREIAVGLHNQRDDRDPEPGVVVVQYAPRGSTGFQNWPDVMFRYEPPKPEISEDLMTMLAATPIVTDPAAYDSYGLLVEIRDLMKEQLAATRQLVEAWTSSTAELTSTEDSENKPELPGYDIDDIDDILGKL